MPSNKPKMLNVLPHERGMDWSQIRLILVAWGLTIIAGGFLGFQISKITTCNKEVAPRETALPAVSQPAPQVYPQ
jgi:hypothetical protein